LSALIHLHDQALWYHRQALQSLKAGDYAEAQAKNDQALALHHQNADFHALAGRLWALQGEFGQAIASWKQAQKLDTQHPTACGYLKIWKELWHDSENAVKVGGWVSD
jgi:Flp pilus assembly protein TadD